MILILKNCVHMRVAKNWPAQCATWMKERGAMAQEQKRVQLPIIGILLAAVVAGVSVVTWRRIAKPKQPAKVSKHKVENSSQDALNYWTKDKMRSTHETNMPNVNNLERKQ